MDGEITIGTTLNTDKFDRQITQLEKKMQKEEDKKIVLEAKIDIQEEMLEEAIKKTDELAEVYQRYKKLQDTIASGKATPQQFTMFQELQNTYGSIEKLELSFLKALNKQDEINIKATEMKTKYQDINDKVEQYKQKIEGIKLQKQVNDVEKLKSSFNSVGNSIKNSIRNVARLALGVFGVRSAFMLLRRASSYLANYDKQYAANIEYIRYALTQAIAPVLRWIVQMAATLLGYINAILQGWFGINLFSRGSAENFNKMKASTGGISKAVKEIKKQLLGFDEINMLTNQSDTGTSAGVGGVGTTMPDFDLSAMQGDIPPWLQWIIDHKDEILSTLAGIAAGLIAWKKELGGIKALGIGILVKGIIDLIESLIDYLKDPSWENFGKVVKSIGEIILGIGTIMGKTKVAVAAVVVYIAGLIIEHWDEIKKVLQKAVDWLKGKSDWIYKNLGGVVGKLYDFFVRVIQRVIDWFDLMIKSVKGVFDGIIKVVKGVFTGNWKLAWEGVKQIFQNIWNALKGTVKIVLDTVWDIIKTFAKIVKEIFQNIWKGIKTIFSGVGKFFSTIFKGAWEGIKKIFSGVGTFFGNLWKSIKKPFASVKNFFSNAFKGAWDGVKRVFSGVGKFFGDMWKTIKSKFTNIGQKIGDAVGAAFRGAVNAVMRIMENVLNVPIKAVNALLGVINKIPRN